VLSLPDSAVPYTLAKPLIKIRTWVTGAPERPINVPLPTLRWLEIASSTSRSGRSRLSRKDLFVVSYLLALCRDRWD
jgi:hypothetical protein